MIQRHFRISIIILIELFIAFLSAVVWALAPFWPGISFLTTFILLNLFAGGMAVFIVVFALVLILCVL